MTDMSEDTTVNDTNTANAKPAREVPSFNEGDKVFINRGKHRGQNATVTMVAVDNQYGVRTDGGVAVVVNAASLRDPQSPSLDSSALANILATVRASVPAPQRHVIVKVATAAESVFPGFTQTLEDAIGRLSAESEETHAAPPESASL